MSDDYNFDLMRLITGGLCVHVDEDRVLYDALRDYLQREPQVADISGCIMKFKRDTPDEYLFCYGDTRLGKIKKDLRIEFDFDRNVPKMVYEILFYPSKQNAP